MERNRTILAVAVGFVGGLAVGVLLVSAADGPLRSRVARRFRRGREALDRGLRQVEEQLREIDAALDSTLDQFRVRARSAGVERVDWSVEGDEVARELRHMPRR